MRTFGISMSVLSACVCLCVTPVMAQDGSDQNTDSALENENAQVLAEDMEIMSGIVADVVAQLYKAPAGQQMLGIGVNSDASVHGFEVYRDSNPWISNRETTIDKPLATYLAGHGVVFQLQAPPLRPLSKTGKKNEITFVCPFTSRSAWERKQMNLRGEWAKIDCKKCHVQKQTRQADLFSSLLDRSSAYQSTKKYVGKDKSPTKDQLIDKLLGLLAENGHNFRGLEQNRRLTVAITFRPKKEAKQILHSGQSKDGYYYYYSSETKPKTGTGGTPFIWESLDTDKKKKTAKRKANQRKESDAQPNNDVVWTTDKNNRIVVLADSGNDELAGDLHLRQGNYQQAIEAYEKAIQDALHTTPYRSLTFLPTDAIALRLTQKLAQAQLGAGDIKKAQILLKNLASSTKDSKTAKGDFENDILRKSILPARLTISVTKKQLDAVAAKTITHDEFAKGARISYFDPTKQLPSETTNKVR